MIKEPHFDDLTKTVPLRPIAVLHLPRYFRQAVLQGDMVGDVIIYRREERRLFLARYIQVWILQIAPKLAQHMRFMSKVPLRLCGERMQPVGDFRDVSYRHARAQIIDVRNQSTMLLIELLVTDGKRLAPY
jgi:hypothetical protein